MAMKSATFQNCMLSTHLYRFPASFKYYLFPQMINLACLALVYFWKRAKGGRGLSFPNRKSWIFCYLNIFLVNNFRNNCNIVSRYEGGVGKGVWDFSVKPDTGFPYIHDKSRMGTNLTRAGFNQGPCQTNSAFLRSFKLWFIKILILIDMMTWKYNTKF